MKAHFEPIVPLQTNSFKAAVQAKKEFDFPWHYHPEYELTYIASSHGVRYVGNSMENFTSGDLVLLGPNLPHCWKNTEKQEALAEAVVFQWKENMLGEDWMNKQEFAAIQKLLKLSVRGIKFNEEVAIQLKEKIYRLLDVPSFEKLILLLEILQDLALTTDFDILCEHGFDSNLNFNDSERINTVYQYVKKYYHQKITLEDVAKEVNMSKEYFSRYFSSIMNKAFFTFLNEYRINNACRLLIESDLQVSELCYCSGYESIPYFYKQFKKIKGVSPQQYRMKFLENNP